MGALKFAGVFQQVLNGTVLLNQFFGGLWPYTRTSRDVVGGVAHEAQDVDELRGLLDAIFGLDFFHSHHLVLARVKYFDIGCHKLAEILVTGDHISEEALLLGLMGQGANDIIGLKAFDLKNGNAIGLKNALDVRHCYQDALGRLLTVSLIGLVVLVSEGFASRRVKAHGDV